MSIGEAAKSARAFDTANLAHAFLERAAARTASVSGFPAPGAAGRYRRAVRWVAGDARGADGLLHGRRDVSDAPVGFGLRRLFPRRHPERRRRLLRRVRTRRVDAIAFRLRLGFTARARCQPRSDRI
jgi:hypothetical protein